MSHIFEAYQITSEIHYTNIYFQGGITSSSLQCCQRFHWFPYTHSKNSAPNNICLNCLASLTSRSLAQASQESTQSCLFLRGRGTEKLRLPHEWQLISSLQSEAVGLTVLAELPRNHLWRRRHDTARQKLKVGLLLLKNDEITRGRQTKCKAACRSNGRNTNLDTESDRLHDKDPVGEDSCNFLHTGKILDRIPDVSVFIQQLELSCREDGSRTGQTEEKEG